MSAFELLASEGLALPVVAREATGRGVRIAIVDTGVNFDHPHLALVQRGFGVDWIDGELVTSRGTSAHRDRFGHGTCCAALCHALAPDAELFAVRVTSDRASTDADRLATGIELAASEGAAIISVALGTETRVRARLDRVVAAAVAGGAVVVASDPGEVAYRVLPAGCPGAIAVVARDGVDVELVREASVDVDAICLAAEGRARPATGYVRNFFGASLSAARAAAAIARFAEASGLCGEALRRGFEKALVVL